MKKIIFIASMFFAVSSASAQKTGSYEYPPTMMQWGRKSYNAKEDSIAKSQVLSMEYIQSVDKPRVIIILNDNTVINGDASKNAKTFWSATRNGQTVQMDSRINSITYWFEGTGFDLVRNNASGPNKKPGDRNIVYMKQINSNSKTSQQKK
jgi:hypothetical protein